IVGGFTIGIDTVPY
nr:RecName: Full=Cocoonase [Limulus polyphemus]